MACKRVLIFILIFFSCWAKADNWNDFSLHMEQSSNWEEKKGLAYILSGALIAVGGSIGYHNAEDDVEKSSYSLSQSLGIAAIGYGWYLAGNGGEDRKFYSILQNTDSLNEHQKSELLRSYLHQQKQRQKNARWLRILTHSVIATASVYNASNEESEGSANTLYVFGGINAVMALSLTF